MSVAELVLDFSSDTEVTVTFAGTQSGKLVFTNPLTVQDRADLSWYVETYASASLAQPDDDEAQRIAARLPEIGEALFLSVFSERAAQRLFNAFQEATAAQRVLTIRSEDAAVLSLPWELLRDPSGSFLFREKPHISIRRSISGATGGRPAFRVEPKDRLHLLFVISRPKGTGFIDPRADSQAVLDALEQHAPGRIQCEFLRAATLNALVERLDDETRPAVDILHFDGHGVFLRMTEQDAQEEPSRYGKSVLSEIQRERQFRKAGGSGERVSIGFLLFEKEDGTNHLIPASELAENLFRSKVGLVVLSACQSAALEEVGDPMASVAGKLTSTGIPAILAMTHSVLVATTRTLFGRFYASLARGRGIATALDDARTYLANNPEKFEVQRGNQRQMLKLQDWFVPTLFHGGTDRPLLTPAALPSATRLTENQEAAKKSNLRPRHEAGFFGRRRELWDIACWFDHTETRRVSLTGFGGQGKTELAIEAARWLLRTSRFERAVFIDYAQVQSEDAVSVAVRTISSVLERTLTDAGATTQALAEVSTLLILDNLEALSPRALGELLDAAVPWSEAGASRVLLTARTPDFQHAAYRIEGTRVHRRIPLRGLGSSTYPDGALAWFAELGKLPSAMPVPVRPPQRQELISLFHRVDFHPLSIAVLAQQLKTRTALELGTRLEQILSDEATSRIAPDGTPANLVASLQLSLERLTPAERHAVRHLGIFQGGAFEDNLLAITELGEGDAERAQPENPPSLSNVWPALRRQLEAAALIEIESVSGIRPPFLRFHPTLAPMLWAGLEKEEQTTLSLAHRKRYYALVNYLYNSDPKTPQKTRAIARRELSNLLHAVHQALDTGNADAVDFVDSVNHFLSIFGLAREAASLTRRAEQAGGKKGSKTWVIVQRNRGEQLLASGRPEDAARIFSEILETLGDVPSSSLTATLCYLGRCYEAGRRPDLAEREYRKGIAVNEQLGQSDPVVHEAGMLHTNLADVLRKQGRFTDAREHYEKSLEIARELGYLRGEGVVLGQLGTLALQENNLPNAIERYREALELFQRLDEPLSESTAHHQLGMVLHREKQWEQAEQHYREAARLSEALGAIGGPSGAASTWDQLAQLSQQTGRLHASEQWYRKAIEARRDDPSGLAVSLNNLANLLETQPARLVEARQLAEQSLAIAKTLDPDAAEIWKTYSLLAQIAESQSEPNQAAEYRRQGREAKRNFAGTAHETKRFAPVIAMVVAAVHGSDEAQTHAAQFVTQWQATGGEYAQFAQSIERILAGERNEDALTEHLVHSASVVETILAELNDSSE